MIIFSETTGPIGTKLCMMMFVRSFTEISIWFGLSDEHGCYGNFFFLKFWLAKNKKNKNLPWNLVHLFVRLSIPHFILIQMAAMHNHFLFLISSWYKWLQCTIIFYSSFYLDTDGFNAQSFFLNGWNFKNPFLWK